MLQCKNKEENYIQNKLIEKSVIDTLYGEIIEDP